MIKKLAMAEMANVMEIPHEMDFRVAALAMLNVFIGLTMIALPFLQGVNPGNGLVTAHVTLGALLAALSLFRVLLAFRVIWLDGLCAFLGGLILWSPWPAHMVWNQRYLMEHVVAGGLVILFCVLCTALTLTRRPATAKT